MKKIFVLLFLCVQATQFASAQDYLTGKITDSKGETRTIYYDRTQLLVSSSEHQTQYKVFDEGKNCLYNIFLTHDQKKRTVSFSINTGNETKGRTVIYSKEQCGLIFSDAGDMDTVFPEAKAYLYLFSFTDTLRDYPVLHKIKTSDDNELELDPLTRLRIKKHNTLVRKINPLNPNVTVTAVAKSAPAENNEALKTDEQARQNSLVYSLLNDSFNLELFALRDSLYTKNSWYIDIITRIKTIVETDVANGMKNALVYSDESHYSGQEKNGIPQGKGVMVRNSNIYDGNFTDGEFVTGMGVIKSKNAVYYGECKGDTMSGKGWLKYSNGSFLLGEFKNGQLYQGISLWKENNEVFFGNVLNGAHNGYGELRNSRGDNFYGEFLNGRLVKGYSKEIDQFGYSTYSRIQNGAKATVAPQLAEIFFDKIHVIKEKAEAQ